MKIKNEADAKQVWKRIEDKYAFSAPEKSARLPEIPLKNPTSKPFWKRLKEKPALLVTEKSTNFRDTYSKKRDPKDFEKKLSDEDLKNIERIQRYWNKRRNQDTFVSVRSKGNYPDDQEPKGNYPDGLHHLVNQQKIKRSLNRKKLSSLLQAIRSGNWDDMIFEDKTIPQLAMSLYAASQITQQQIYSILEHHQIKKELKINKTYQILDENNQFTPEAMKYLSKVFKNRRYLKPLSDEKIEEFRLLISTLPSSERVFYTSNLGSVENESLGKRLVVLDSIYMKDNELIHLTSGARDALGIARFGENEYVRAMLRLGKQTVHDIEHGVKKQARYTAISYPETESYSDGLHDWQNVTPFEATSHDFYHMNVMSSIPKNLLRGIWRFIDLTREKTGINMSKEIWDWIDADFNFTFYNNNNIQSGTDDLDLTQSTALFCNILRHETSAGNNTPPERTFFYHNPWSWSPTVLSITVYLDMIKNKDEWLKIGINPDLLTDPFKEHLGYIKKIYPIIQKNSFKIQIIKCLIAIEVSFLPLTDTFETIDKFAKTIEQKISLKKIKKAEATSNSPANTIQYAYDGEEISGAKIYSDVSRLNDLEKSSSLKKQDELKKTLNFKRAFSEWIKENPITSFMMCVPVLTPFLIVYVLIQVRNHQLKKTNQTMSTETDSETSPLNEDNNSNSGSNHLNG